MSHLGYYPAAKAAELYGTYGLHPLDILPRLRARSMKMDWGGLLRELIYANGMTRRSAESLIAECRAFERDLDLSIQHSRG